MLKVYRKMHKKNEDIIEMKCLVESIPILSIPDKDMAGRRGGTERVLSKLKTSIENENYYEAHQMYRTLYFR